MPLLRQGYNHQMIIVQQIKQRQYHTGMASTGDSGESKDQFFADLAEGCPWLPFPNANRRVLGIYSQASPTSPTTCPSRSMTSSTRLPSSMLAVRGVIEEGMQ